MAHHVFGVANTINSANYVYFLGLQKAMTLSHTEVSRVFTGLSAGKNLIENYLQSYCNIQLPVYAQYIFRIQSLVQTKTIITCIHVPNFTLEQLLELHRGQGMDIYWRDAYSCPTEEEYEKMVIKSKCSDSQWSTKTSM